MQGIIAPLLSGPVKHLYKLIFSSEYRRYYWLVSRYGSTPRYREQSINLYGRRLIVPDVASFLAAFKEIFVKEIYAFRAETPDPVIIDCGANIGLSVIYFKRLYPKSKIVAFEADPEIYRALEKNIHGNGYNNVELVNKAVWSAETTVGFRTEGADAGKIEVGGKYHEKHMDEKNIIDVPTVRLADYLKGNKIDFLKVDIEGAEVEVLRDCTDFIDNLRFVFVEFHSVTGKKQELGDLISLFEEKGFRVHVHPEFVSSNPFMGVAEHMGMDLQLNIFFWKHEVR